MARKIKDIASLDKEIRRMQEKAQVLEGKLDESLDYLQDNYSSMLVNSVFNTGGMKSTVTGTVLSFLLGNEKLRDAFSKIINHLTDKVAAGLDILADKLGGKKEE